MTWLSTMTAVRSRFDTLVGTPNSLPTIHDNAPTNGVDVSGLYAHVTVLNAERDIAENGGQTGNNYRAVGILRTTFYGPSEQGTGDLLGLIDSLDTAFRSQTVGGVVYRVPSVVRQGHDGAKFFIVVDTRFLWDEFA